MPPLEKSGFLGNSMAGWVQKIRTQHSELFVLANDVNETCQTSMFELKPHSKNLQELLVATLYIRVLSNYQAAILLAERGMMPEARTMARALLEAVFSLVALAKDEQLVRDYVHEDQKNRLKFLKKYEQLHGGNFPKGITKEEIQALEAELRSDIGTRQIKVRTTEEWSQEAGLHAWYLTAYAVLSLSVHSKVRDLEGYLTLDDKGEIREFNWGPNTNGTKEILVTIIEAMLVSFESVSASFEQDKTARISSLHTRLQGSVSE